MLEEKGLNSLLEKQTWSKSDVMQLLQIPNDSEDFKTLLRFADDYARKKYHNKGTVFAQIGMDVQPCSVNCKFCSLGKDNFDGRQKKVKTVQEVVAESQNFVAQGAQEVFLMTTAEFPQKTFLEYAQQVYSAMNNSARLIVNIGDFDDAYAQKLKQVGVFGVYHICRLREGKDTSVPLSVRIRTLDAIKKANLHVYYCVEPIGCEHTNDEIADEILRGQTYGASVMAVMKRVNIKGTPYFGQEEVSDQTLAKLTAVSLLCVKPALQMGVHEQVALCLHSGANQIYAECGANPRDIHNVTENHRGFTVKKAQEMLKEAGYIV